MRFLPLFFLLTLTLFASPKELNSFNSKFIQTIVDENGKKIIYHGELWADKPQNALWVYQKPIQKSVYINGQKITVIEPQIEQVTIRSLDDEIDFLQIIQKAKKIDENRYTATVKGQTYSVLFKNNLLTSISYKDGYDNSVTIVFTTPVQNKAIESTRFKPVIPENFDIIKDR
ncbi:MAG: LolA-like outer membrane lipoprotein chaperone [Sulfuricurvum sp.]|uniref:LolA-like outer membrane lipoprotein chaperone n=1 Tax=Sulfuricurvum sp. TaxID=2025608 RepID=UPI002609D1FF|nr:LolA-like outer membrane lipoprotein chaperone [Sulfuricurvum sp.]MDD2368847.1 LolA-like outer membrane lipoprotein chaperone [Sulfuricurvum sp.]MDD5119572.1 LolA-like outer membrane lipoprotein chaperone [Sulfuricurvum sp.]